MFREATIICRRDVCLRFSPICRVTMLRLLPRRCFDTRFFTCHLPPRDITYDAADGTPLLLRQRYADKAFRCCFASMLSSLRFLRHAIYAKSAAADAMLMPMPADAADDADFLH